VLADEMRAEENRLLRLREADRRSVQMNTWVVQALGGTLALALLSASVIAARRATAGRAVAEAARAASDERFRKLAEAAFEGRRRR
jgi:hypothetical protein